MGLNKSKIVQTCLNLPIRVSICPNLSTFVQTCPNLFRFHFMYDLGGAALLLLLMMLDPLKPDVTTTACVDKYFTAYHAPCLIDRAARVFVVLGTV